MLPLKLPRFSLVAATTRTGLLSAPFLSRFGIVLRLDYYTPAELTEIVRRSARKLGVALEPGGAEEIGRRARGTPRIANHLLKRVRDFAEVQGDGRVTREVAAGALARLGVDELGLDELDRTLLRTIIQKFDGGPVGVESLGRRAAPRSATRSRTCASPTSSRRACSCARRAGASPPAAPTSTSACRRRARPRSVAARAPASGSAR